jgi:hypothetical protein
MDDDTAALFPVTGRLVGPTEAGALRDLQVADTAADHAALAAAILAQAREVDAKSVAGRSVAFAVHGLLELLQAAHLVPAEGVNLDPDSDSDLAHVVGLGAARRHQGRTA